MLVIARVADNNYEEVVATINFEDVGMERVGAFLYYNARQL